MAFLGETLDSVLKQTYENWECIVIDDGSLDRTLELMEFYCSLSKKISYHQRDQGCVKGAASCKNFGYQISKGTYVMWLDDDDLIHKDKLKNQIHLLKGTNDVLATCAWSSFTSINQVKLKPLGIYKDYDNPVNLLIDYGLEKSYFPSHVFLHSKILVQKAGLWRTDLEINDDGEFFSRIILASNKVRFANDTFVLYRQHFSNRVSHLNNHKKGRDAIRSWKLIKKNLPKSKRRKAQIYIDQGNKHIYYLLKQAGFRSIIFKNLLLFNKLILSDLNKKFKNYYNGDK